MGARQAWSAAAAAILLAGLIGVTGAWAAGGPYVVDDSEVTPGECKLESWGSRANTHDWIAVASPACTFTALPAVELGFTAQRSRSDDSRVTTIGPKAKVALLPLDANIVGIALAGTFLYSTTDERFDSGAVTVPISFQPWEALRLNLNLGWMWERAESRNLGSFGAGFEWTLIDGLTLIGEVFGRDRGRGGAQLGLRPVLIDEVLELDLVYGRNIDGSRSDWATLGATIRF